MFNAFFKRAAPADLTGSQLYDQDGFYAAFLKDLSKCQHEVIIESPFITRRRFEMLLPTIEKLKKRRVRVVINTRNPLDSEKDHMRDGSMHAIAKLQHLGVQVLFTGGHHRKLAILDRQILWEGSLNILSQNDSCEVMRRIPSTQLAWQMTRFTGIDKFIS
jgi:phosphatidylserine/phosphatidylglycerophosphate/cardiolipin synthase-like enzyme